MAKFKKCPRCELNYIPVEEEYCALCKEELKGLVFTDTEDDDEEEGLCPRCKTNYLNEGEKYCEQCQKEIEAEKEKSAHADYWEEEEMEVTEDDTEDFILDDADIASLGELADEEFEEDFDDEEEEPDYFEEDDFETVSADDYDDEDEEDDEEDYDY